MTPKENSGSSKVNFSGIVLNGGTSSRMGESKAEVNFLGRPLIDRGINALQRAGATEVIIVGGKPPHLNENTFIFVEDLYPGEGPLGGLITGLLTAETKNAFVISNDLMDIDEGVFKKILKYVEMADLVVPVAAGIPQVLSALWKVSAVSHLQDAYNAGNRSVRSVLSGLDVLEIFEFGENKFVNANTSSDIIDYIAKLEKAIE